MSFEKECILTLVGAFIIMSIVASLLYWRMSDAYQEVKELRIENQMLRERVNESK